MSDAFSANETVLPGVRRAAHYLDETTIRALLALAEDEEICGIEVGQNPPSISISIISPRVGPVLYGCQAPSLRRPDGLGAQRDVAS